MPGASKGAEEDEAAEAAPAGSPRAARSSGGAAGAAVAAVAAGEECARASKGAAEDEGAEAAPATARQGSSLQGRTQFRRGYSVHRVALPESLVLHAACQPFGLSMTCTAKDVTKLRHARSPVMNL